MLMCWEQSCTGHTGSAPGIFRRKSLIKLSDEREAECFPRVRKLYDDVLSRISESCMHVERLNLSPHSLLNGSQWNLHQSIDKSRNEQVDEVSAPETNQEAVWEAKTPQKLDITAECIMCFLSCEGTVSVIINRRKFVLIPIDCKFCLPCRGGVEKSKFHQKLIIWVNERPN